METEEIIRQRIRERYETDPHIRVNVSMSRPKLILKNAEATITGVYNHLFQIEETMTGARRRHTISYADVITRRVEIIETIPDKE